METNEERNGDEADGRDVDHTPEMGLAVNQKDYVVTETDIVVNAGWNVEVGRRVDGDTRDVTEGHDTIDMFTDYGAFRRYFCIKYDDVFSIMYDDSCIVSVCYRACNGIDMECTMEFMHPENAAYYYKVYKHKWDELRASETR